MKGKEIDTWQYIKIIIVEHGTENPQHKRTCMVSDLSSPLLYHGAVGYVCSVKDCPICVIYKHKNHY